MIDRYLAEAMSDYRVERVRIRLSDAIEGFDPNATIDTTELAWIDPSGIDSHSCGAIPLSEYYAAGYSNWQEDDKWFTAEVGLESVQKLINHFRRHLSEGNDPLGRQADVLEAKIKTLAEIEAVLKVAAEHQVHFCLAVSD